MTMWLIWCCMVIEKLPEVQRFTREEQYQLMSELWDQVLPDEDPVTQSEIGKLLESRMEHFRQNPGTASTWAEVKSRFEQARPWLK